MNATIEEIEKFLRESYERLQDYFGDRPEEMRAALQDFIDWDDYHGQCYSQYNPSIRKLIAGARAALGEATPPSPTPGPDAGSEHP